MPLGTKRARSGAEPGGSRGAGVDSWMLVGVGRPAAPFRNTGRACFETPSLRINNSRRESDSVYTIMLFAIEEFCDTLNLYTGL